MTTAGTPPTAPAAPPASEAYRSQAGHYDRPGSGAFRQWRELLVASLPLRPGDTVLDVGCGTGLCAPLLNPDRAALLDRLQAHQLPGNWSNVLPSFEPDAQGTATRKASGAVLSALAPVLPELWDGSADLAESNNTMDGADSFVPPDRQTKEWRGGPYGRTLHLGIREHAMAAALNGIALQSLTRAYGGTFLAFSDYMRPAVRLAALMQLPAIYVSTHDSIGLGEDGPTHQPVEQLASLRNIPGLDVVRPGDANETSHLCPGRRHCRPPCLIGKVRT